MLAVLSAAQALPDAPFRRVRRRPSSLRAKQSPNPNLGIDFQRPVPIVPAPAAPTLTVDGAGSADLPKVVGYGRDIPLRLRRAVAPPPGAVIVAST